jgi:hypothetical protein
MGLPIDPSTITSPVAFEKMLRELGFSRAFAKTATARGFAAAHSDSEKFNDDQAVKAALGRMLAVASNIGKDQNE